MTTATMVAFLGLSLATADGCRAAAETAGNADASKGSQATAKSPGPGNEGPNVTGFVARLSIERGINLVPIPPGSFVMGSPDDEAGRSDDEGPQTRVTISQSYFLGETALTTAQWAEVMGSDSTSGEASNSLPVANVTWDEAEAFCRKLTERERNSGHLPDGWEFSLPTEAQWEYACRAGTAGPFAGSLDDLAWYEKNSGNHAHPVGTKPANAWGIYDMHGNVSVWCADVYEDRLPGENAFDPEGPLPEAPSDPATPPAPVSRAVRGGSWSDSAAQCRSASRVGADPASAMTNVGVRIALVHVDLPRPARDYMKKGFAAAAAGDWQSAMESFDMASGAAPDAPVVQYNLGVAQSKLLGEEKAAIDTFNAYLLANPDAPNSAAIKDEIADLVRKVDYPPETRVAVEAGLEAAQKQDWAAAVVDFEVASKEAPHVPKVLYYLGLAESKISGKEQAAISAFTAYLSANPDAPKAKDVKDMIEELKGRSAFPLEAREAVNRGENAARHDDWLAAIQNYEQARTLVPESPEIIYRLGMAESQVPGRELRAAAWLAAYLTGSPESKIGDSVRQEIAALVGSSRANINRYIKFVEEATLRLPDSPDHGPHTQGYSRDFHLSNIGTLYAYYDDITDALRLLPAIRLPEFRGPVLAHIVESQLRMGDLAGARATSNLIQDPDSRESAANKIRDMQGASPNRGDAPKDSPSTVQDWVTLFTSHSVNTGLGEVYFTDLASYVRSQTSRSDPGEMVDYLDTAGWNLVSMQRDIERMLKAMAR